MSKIPEPLTPQEVSRYEFAVGMILAASQNLPEHVAHGQVMKDPRVVSALRQLNPPSQPCPVPRPEPSVSDHLLVLARPLLYALATYAGHQAADKRWRCVYCQSASPTTTETNGLQHSADCVVHRAGALLALDQRLSEPTMGTQEPRP